MPSPALVSMWKRISSSSSRSKRSRRKRKRSRRQNCLLIAQRLHRIDARRPARGKVGGERRHGEHQRGRASKGHRVGGRDAVKENLDQAARDERERGSGRQTDGGDAQRFTEE